MTKAPNLDLPQARHLGLLAANGIVSTERNGAEGLSSQPCPFKHLDRTDTQWRLSAANSTSHFTNYFITRSSKTQTIFPTWEFFPERLIPCQHQPIVASCYCLFKVFLLSVLTWVKFHKNTTFTLQFFSFIVLICKFLPLNTLASPSFSPHMRSFLLELISIKSLISPTKELVFIMLRYWKLWTR